MPTQIELLASHEYFLAAKTLSRVEVDPTTSHQHEFHAGTLRRLLHLPSERIRGRLLILFYLVDDAEPLLDDGSFTMYDARENIEGRSEWHLYYTTSAIAEHAQEGDLLLIFRSGSTVNELRAVIARA